MSNRSEPERTEPDISQVIFGNVDARDINVNGSIHQTVILGNQESEAPRSLQISWRNCCREMLLEQKRLTTNPFTTRHGSTFELEKIYVPLGLVERRQLARRSSDASPELGSHLYQPEGQYEVTQTFQHNEFLEQVLRQGESPKSKGQRLAIIGEPGSGKTTLLQKIAFWVLDNLEAVPIWISLADLQGKSLDEYLLQDWLKAATAEVRVTKAMEDALAAQFDSGKVWLLLDGVDEIASSSVNALESINKQLTGWVRKARIVMTCRLNIWDASKNALEAFDTYRNLDFSYGDAQTPNQVGQFIDSWFSSNREQGEGLRVALNQPGRERIKDTVKNPLRLALLCSNWQLRQGGLPETKAELYGQFVKALYEWKQERFPTSAAQRRELNQALGQLALQAISEQESRFRLRHRLVCRVLGEPDEPLFRLALQLGWLNQVGVAVENPEQEVYAFFHPTFQEHFAAQAIPDWHYFLKHNPSYPAEGTYRIFEPQWREVILLWLGRDDISKQQKEEFIWELLTFEDGCQNFYGYRAYLLAAAGIAEFRDFSCADEIVAQIVKWCFDTCTVPNGSGGFYDERETFVGELGVISEAILQETERSRAIAVLANLLRTTQVGHILWSVIEKLKQIDPGNPDATAVISHLLHSSEDESARLKLAQMLDLIAPGNSDATAALTHILQNSQDEDNLKRCLWNLPSIHPNNINTITTALTRLLHNTQSEQVLVLAASCLGKIDPGNLDAINALVSHVKTRSEEGDFFYSDATDLMELFSPDNSDSIVTLTKLLHLFRDDSTLIYTAERLGEIDPGNSNAIATLVNLLQTTPVQYISYLEAFCSLVRISPDNAYVINALTSVLYSADSNYLDLLLDGDTLKAVADGFRQNKLYDSDISDIIDVLTYRLHSTHDEETFTHVAECLAEFGPGNYLEAIATLTDYLHLIHSDIHLMRVAKSLNKIAPGNSEAIAVLFNLLHTTQKEDVLVDTALILSKITCSNTDIITSITDFLLTQDPYINRSVKYLKSIDQRNLLLIVVSNLRYCLNEPICKSNSEFSKYVWLQKIFYILWHCAQNLTYPDFYQAWHA